MRSTTRNRPIDLVLASAAAALAVGAAGCSPTATDPIANGDCVVPTLSLHFGEDNPHLADMFENDNMAAGDAAIEYFDEDGAGPQACRPSVTWVLDEQGSSG